MGTSKEYNDFILDSLSGVGDITTKKMMGEYLVYYRGKLVGDICDNQLLLKPTDAVLRYFPDAVRVYPYEGSKTLMTVVENVEDVEFLKTVLDNMYLELPESKKRKNK